MIKAYIPKKCLFWNFQLNSHFMESLDYVHFAIHINGDRAEYEFEGKEKKKCAYIVVVHEEFMGRKECLPLKYRNLKMNYLSTAHHKKGTMLFRWLKADKYEHPTTDVVTLSTENANEKY